MFGIIRPKIKCKLCKDIITSNSDSEWTECSCGETAVMGKSFLRIKGKNFENLSTTDTSKLPPCKDIERGDK